MRCVVLFVCLLIVFMIVDACKAPEVRVMLLMEFIIQPVPVLNEVKVLLGEYDRFVWRSKNEYKFLLEGRSLAGIPTMKHQYSGIHFNGILNIGGHTEGVLLISLQHMQYTTVRSLQLPNGWWQDLPGDRTVYQTLPISEAPIAVRTVNGKVNRVVVTKNHSAWEINLLQAVASHLQLDLSASQEHRPHSSKTNTANSGDNDVYTTMEHSLAGNCEVLYEIAPITMSEVVNMHLPSASLCGLGTNFFAITKTRNYSNCDFLEESHFGLPKMLRCTPGGNECGAFWTRNSVSRMIGCGNRRILKLLNAVTSSQVVSSLNFVPEDILHGHPGNHASVGTYLNLTLLSSLPIATPSKKYNVENSYVIHGLRFQFDTDHMKRGSSDERRNDDSTDCEETMADSPNQGDDTKKKKCLGKRSVVINEEETKNRTTPMETLERRPYVATEPHSEHNDYCDTKNTSFKFMPHHMEAVLQQPPSLPFSAFSMAHTKEGICLIMQLMQKIEEIANDLDTPETIPQQMTLEKLHIAVQMCRTMSFLEIMKVTDLILSRHPGTVMQAHRKLLYDVITMCGTAPTVNVIKWLIQSKMVHGEDAAEMVSSVPSYLLTPSPVIVKKLYELVRLTTANQVDEQTKIASVIAFSHVVRVTCSSEAVRKMRSSEPFKACKAADMKTYLQYLQHKIHSDHMLRQVYIMALGNTGLHEALPILLSVIKSNSTNNQKISAILAMKYIMFKEPLTVMYKLLTFFNNPTYPSAVRLAALSMLFYSRPPLSVWQRIAISTWYEPDEALNSYVWSTLNSLATMNDPFYNDMTENALAVLPLVRALPQGLHRAYNWMRTAATNSIHEVLQEQLSWSTNAEAANLYYRQTVRLGGFSRLMFEADAWVTDADRLLRSLANLINNQTNVEEARPPISDLPRSTHNIRQTLGIIARELPRMEGSLSYKLGNYYERMHMLDVDKLLSTFKEAERHIPESNHTSHLLHQKFGETGFWIAVPNELGFPVEQRISAISLIRTQVNLNGPRTRGAVSANVSLLFASQLVSELSVYTPFDFHQYVAGTKSHTFFQLPRTLLAARWELQKKRQLEMSINPGIETNEKHLIFSQKSRPYTSQYNITSLQPISLAETTLTINVAPFIYTEILPGSPIQVLYSSQTPSHRWSLEPHWVLSYATLWPSLEAASLEVFMPRASHFNVSFTLGHAKSDSKADWQPSGNSQMNCTNADGAGGNETVVITTEPSLANIDLETTNTDQPDYSQIGFKGNCTNDKLTILSTRTTDRIANFNASTLRLLNLEPTKSRSTYLLNEVLKGMLSGEAYLVGAAINVSNSTSPDYNYQLYITHGWSRSKLVQRSGVFVLDDKEKWQMGVTVTQQYPSAPMLLLRSILQANLTSYIFGDFNYIANNSEHIASLKGSLLSTERQINQLRNSTITTECLQQGLQVQPQCYHVGTEAGFLDRFNGTITYNDNAYVNSGSVSRYLGIVKHALLPYLTDEVIDSGTEDKGLKHVRMIAEFNSEMHTVAMWVRTSHLDTELNYMPVNSVVMQALRFNPIKGYLPYLQETSFCSYEKQQFVTFDNQRYYYRATSDSWHVLAKDCSGRSRVAILIRFAETFVDLEVNLDNYKIIRVLPNESKILVNECEVYLEDEQIAEAYDQARTRILEFFVTNDKALRINLPAHGFSILHSYSTVLVQADSKLRGRLCGLCGNFNGNIGVELHNPQNDVTVSPAAFARSYALPPYRANN